MLSTYVFLQAPRHDAAFACAIFFTSLVSVGALALPHVPWEHGEHSHAGALSLAEVGLGLSAPRGRSRHNPIQLSEKVEEQLSQERANFPGHFEPLSEEGYQQVASLMDDNAMRAFVQRVLAAEGLNIGDGHDDALMGFVRFYSGIKARQSLDKLQSELRGFKWVQHLPPEPRIDDPVRFFMYDPASYEPRMHGVLDGCLRKGADYMFIESLMNHKDRVDTHEAAEVIVVPCMFESYRRCTTQNHAEQPPPPKDQKSLLLQTRGSSHSYEHALRGSLQRAHENSHPEDFEAIPWTKPIDSDTEQCLSKVMSSSAYHANNGADHLWVVADWTMNFGRTSESSLFKNMTLGRIEVVDEVSSRTSNRPYATEQSRCSIVVPYASDLAYVENFAKKTSFDDWMQRPVTVTFRFEDRRYVLFCKSTPCEGSVDATPLRSQALRLQEFFGHDAMIAMERVPVEQFNEEMHNSKFCLVIRGDTPSSHSFYDAVAASCIPIIVSDRWGSVAGPFKQGRHGFLRGGMDHSSFSLQFDEQRWMADIDGVAAEIQEILADSDQAFSIFENLQRSRSDLLWSMPGSTAAERTLQSAKMCTKYA